MNSKMTTNSQLLTTKPKKTKQKQTKQTIRTRTEPQKWRSPGGLSAGEWVGERGRKVQSKQHKWQVENRQGEVNNSIANVEAKELICMTHRHELKWGECEWEMVCRAEGDKGRKWDTCNSIINKIY